MELAVLDPGMADDDDVSPGNMDVTSQHDNPVSDGAYGLSESLGATAISDPVLPKVSTCSETSRFVETCALGRCHGQVKAVRRLGDALGAGLLEESRR